MKISLILDVDPALADDNDETGLTEQAYLDLMAALSPFGTVDEGPTAIG